MRHSDTVSQHSLASDVSRRITSLEVSEWRIQAISNNFTWPTRVQNLKSLALAVAEILHGVQNSKTGYLTLTTPLSGKIFLRQDGDKLMYQIRSL